MSKVFPDDFVLSEESYMEELLPSTFPGTEPGLHHDVIAYLVNGEEYP